MLFSVKPAQLELVLEQPRVDKSSATFPLGPVIMSEVITCNATLNIVMPSLRDWRGEDDVPGEMIQRPFASN